jgi:thioredoxin 1
MPIRFAPARLFLLTATVAVAACSPGRPSAEVPTTQVGPAHRTAGARPRLVFFMNPNGAPCQLQDRILREMAGELSGRAELIYYRTTDGADLPRFDQFGIRSLPALVLTDAAGTELRRATPGIQSAAQVRALLGL